LRRFGDPGDFVRRRCARPAFVAGTLAVIGLAPPLAHPCRVAQFLGGESLGLRRHRAVAGVRGEIGVEREGALLVLHRDREGAIRREERAAGDRVPRGRQVARQDPFEGLAVGDRHAQLGGPPRHCTDVLALLLEHAPKRGGGLEFAALLHRALELRVAAHRFLLDRVGDADERFDRHRTRLWIVFEKRCAQGVLLRASYSGVLYSPDHDDRTRVRSMVVAARIRRVAPKRMLGVLVALWLALACAAALAQPSAAQKAPLLDSFLAKLPAADVFPGADRSGPVPGSPPVAPVFRGQERVGFAFLTSDFVDTEGYSGKPIHTVVALDNAGTIVGMKIVEHSEPIVLIGIPEQRVVDYLGAFVGFNPLQASGPPRADIVSGATVTVLILGESIVRSAVRVARTLQLGAAAAGAAGAAG